MSTTLSFQGSFLFCKLGRDDFCCVPLEALKVPSCSFFKLTSIQFKSDLLAIIHTINCTSMPVTTVESVKGGNTF